MANVKWDNWRDNLKDASFRGVPFKVASHTAEGGRRTFLHKFPFNDESYLEDFGKETGTYRIEAYIVQSTDNDFDYFPYRDALKDALEAFGPGTLIHPFLGTLRVGVQGNYQLKESFSEGGVARFTITFVDAGRPQQPLEEVVAVDIDATQLSIWDKFNKALQTMNEVGHVVESAMLQVQYYVDAAQAALLTPISVASSVISQALTTVAAIRGSIEAVMSIPDQLSSLMIRVGQVFSALSDLIPGSASTLTDSSLTNANLSMITFGADFPAIEITTPDAQVKQDNQNIIIDTVRCTSLTEAVRSALAAEYASYDDAVAMRDRLMAAFDYVMTGIGQNSQNDELYRLMDDLKKYAAGMMITKGANLPVLRSLSVPADPVPSLVYAQSLYGDLGREQEIIDRNPLAMRHPGLPAGGQELKVLSE